MLKMEIFKGNIVFILFIFNTILYGQSYIQKIDSLKAKLDENISDADFVNLNLEIGELITNFSTIEAEIYFKQALKKLNSNYHFTDKNKKLVSTYNYLGRIERRKNNYHKALEYYFKELKLNERQKDTLRIGKTYHDIAKLYSSKREYDKAIYYVEKALPLRKNDNKNYGMTLRNYGKFLYLIKDFDNALIALDSAKFYSKNNPIHLADVKTIYAKIYRTQNKLHKSLKIFKEAVQTFKAHQKIERKANVFIDLAVVNRLLNHNTKALKYLDSAQIIHQKFKNKKVISNIYLERYKIYNKEKNYKKALENHITYKKYSDSVFTIKKIKDAATIEQNYKHEKSEAIRDIQFEANRNHLQEVAKRHKIQKILYSALLILSTITIIFFIIFYRNKKQVHLKNIQKKELESELLNEKIVFLKYKIDKLLAESKMHVDFKEELAEKLKKIKLKIHSKELVDKYQSILIQIENQTQTDKRIDLTTNLSGTEDVGLELKITKQFPELTKNEREICQLLYLNLSTKEILNIRNTTESAIKSARYRIRKKLQIPKNMELELFIQNSLN